MTLFDDFCAFATGQIVSTDIDPVYPMLKAHYEAEGWGEERRLWFTVLYLAFYHLGSAAKAFEAHPEPIPVTPPFSYPCGLERRRFRGNDLAALFVNSLLDAARGDLVAWVNRLVAPGGKAGWVQAKSAIEKLAWSATWAGYKWADLLKHVHGYPITASDIGMGGKREFAGPIPGMVKLTGLPWQVCAQDIGAQELLLKRALKAGVPFNGLDQLETALCDFNSLTEGRYYVGHDIDQMMNQIGEVESPFWKARKTAIPAAYLGELNGWFGVRKPLKHIYKDEGRIVVL